MDRAPRVRRVTFLPSPPHIPHRVPDDIGLWTPTLPRPRDKASHAIRVPRVGSLPSASFSSHLTVSTLAVRLGVPVIKVSKGLSPSSHFPVGFRLPVDSAVMALRAMPGARRVRRRHRCRPLPSEPGEPVTWYTAQAIDVLQEALCCCEFGDDRSHEPTEDSRGPLSPPLFFGTT